MTEDMKTTELVAVSVFPSVPDAQVAQGVLEEVGIESVIRSDNAGGMYPALDATALLVRFEDVATATEALASLPDAAEVAEATGSQTGERGNGDERNNRSHKQVSLDWRREPYGDCPEFRV